PGSPRAGSARHRAAERRRRVRQGVTATALAAALGVGGWLALSGGGEGGGPVAPPQSEEERPEEP
ncbi:serine/threonine protein kinase, partial [Streptomyces sp. CNQ085]|nr:serine/threonine protein kinase [Streptomyces sp. CNQ085]